MARLIRSFKRGTYEAYDDVFDRLSVNSQILNSGSMSRPGPSMIFLDKRGIETEIYALIGNENGEIITGRDRQRAVIPALEARIADVDRRHRKMNEDRKMKGKTALALDEVSELLNEKLELTAKLDVRKSEVEDLRERLEKFQNHEIETKGKEMFQYGLRLAIRYKDGFPSEVDGCPLINIDDVTCLAEGLYKGLSLADYRKMAVQWMAERKKREDLRFKEQVEKAKSEGLPMPRRKVSSIKTVDKSSLPAFPAGCMNHLDKK